MTSWSACDLSSGIEFLIASNLLNIPRIRSIPAKLIPSSPARRIINYNLAKSSSE